MSGKENEENVPPIQPDGLVDPDTEPATKRPRGRPPKDKLPEEDAGQNDLFRYTLKLKEDEIKTLKNSHKKQLKFLEDQLDAMTTCKEDAVTKLEESENRAKALEQTLTEQIKLLSDDNDAKDKECQLLLDRLNQKELEFNELLEQVDTLDFNCSNDSPLPVEKPKGLIILDEITNVIASHLPKAASWSANRKPLSSITKDVLQSFNFVVFITGTQAMSDGLTWNQLIKDAKQAAQRALENGCHPIFLHLPPVNKKSLTGKVSLFNHMLEKIEGATVLSPDTNNMSKNEFLMEDGVSMKPEGGELFMNLLEKDLNRVLLDLPKVKVESPSAQSSTRMNLSPSLPKDKMSVFLEIEKNQHGKVIGRGGHVIKGLTSNNNVEMSMGHWCEKDKSGELKIMSSGTLISGVLSNICVVKSEITEILKKQ